MAQRRPAPKRPLGGGSLLDDILGKTTKLHSSIRHTRAGDDSLEVASPYMMARPPPGQGASSSLVCKFPECGSTVFDIDMRHGDRVCVRCGIVQNSRSIESQEEEHRTFADDDKAESKKRAEINDGKQGGRTGDASLRTANALANADTNKDDKKLDAWKNKVKDVATKMKLTSAVKDSAFNYCTMFGDSQKARRRRAFPAPPRLPPRARLWTSGRELASPRRLAQRHDELCADPNCRLRKGILRKKDELIAASVLMYALREQGFVRLQPTCSPPTAHPQPLPPHPSYSTLTALHRRGPLAPRHPWRESQP